MMTKQQKIKQLKKEIKWLIESIKMSKESIEQNTNLLREKKSKQARDRIKEDIEESKHAIKYHLKEKKIFEAILGDYSRRI